MRGADRKTQAAATPGKIRIIAGQLRNSRLDVPLAPGLRPTPDRVRETLFNWLMNHVAGARCLDLFAGTGALGIEALSRGAREAVFVERDPALAAALRANLLRLRQQERSRVVNADAAAALAVEDRPFDLAFLDPPFAAGLWNAIAQELETRRLLGPGALIYVESPLDQALDLPGVWQLHREGQAGGVRHALYRRDAGLA